jgi:hypothetical protein
MAGDITLTTAALALAAQTFRDYERHHRSKVNTADPAGPPADAQRKAERNANLAEIMEAAIIGPVIPDPLKASAERAEAVTYTVRDAASFLRGRGLPRDEAMTLARMIRENEPGEPTVERVTFVSFTLRERVAISETDCELEAI